MHTIFKNMNTDRIELTDGYHLEPDGYRGLVLVHEEIGEKENKKTGEIEPTVKRQSHFYPKLSQIFSKYLMVTTNEAKSIEELKQILERVEGKIDNMKDYF
jgi:hypothetical protein